MKTPIYDFVKKYAEADFSRLHMPGHKGHGVLGAERFDITEIFGADELFSPDSVIAESEAAAAEIFGTEATLYSTEGSTLCIKTMLAIALTERELSHSKTVLAARNAHRAFVNAAALLDIDIDWVYGSSNHLCTSLVSEQDVERALSRAEKLPFAVYITSPDYLGNLLDVAKIAEVCRKYSVPLLVDNAHGAYLAFCEPSLHPIALGADMCCDSAHKTLPTLTGGAYLHVSKDAPVGFAECAKARMAVFASTSPSYLILSSLDLCNAYLADGYKEKLAVTVKEIDSLKERISSLSIRVMPSEPMKIVLAPRSFGYTGDMLSDYLRKNRIEAEFSDSDYTVLMPTPENRREDLERVYKALTALSRRKALSESTESEPHRTHTRALSVREAMLSKSERISVRSAVGRIAASPTVSCPPAVPIVVSGEMIEESDIVIFERYGINTVDVVK